MLQNPKWNPCSLSNFISWLEKQNLNQLYDVFDPTTCLLGKYFMEMTGNIDLSDQATTAPRDSILGMLYNISAPPYWTMQDCTFGEALKRARMKAMEV